MAKLEPGPVHAFDLDLVSYQHELTLFPTWIRNYIYYKVWDEINHQGPLLLTWFNFNPSMDK